LKSYRGTGLIALPNGKNDEDWIISRDNLILKDFGMVIFSTTTSCVHDGLINQMIAEGIVYSLPVKEIKNIAKARV
jgi:hypothetical protein